MKKEIEKEIPEVEEALEEFDVCAVDMRFEDEVFLTEEAGDAPDEVEEAEVLIAPITHGIEDAVEDSLEEV